MIPSYETNAPHGYMGDPRRGAAMGRPDFGAHIEAKALRHRRDNVAAALQHARDLYPGERRQIEHYESQLAKVERELDALDLSAPLKFTLQRVRINAGGYDSTGAYWGTGAPLYWAADQSGEIEMTFRADDRADAKARVLADYPAARFYR